MSGHHPQRLSDGPFPIVYSVDVDTMAMVGRQQSVEVDKPACGMVAGVWERLYEEEPLGDVDGADRDTLVLWLQTPCGIYVDMRIPIGCPGRSLETASLAGYSPDANMLAGTSIVHSRPFQQDEVATLLRQKSFAGMLMYSPGDRTDGEALAKDKVLAELVAGKRDDSCVPLCTCFWRRDIDFQPPTGGLDIGVCASGPQNANGTVEMRETGADASYGEGWLRHAETENGPFFALKLLSEEGLTGRQGYWVRVGNRFAYSVGRPSTLEASQTLSCHSKSCDVAKCTELSLSDALHSLVGDNHENMLAAAWSYLVVCGEIRVDGSWLITSSIHPQLVGCVLIGNRKTSNCCSILQEVAGYENEVDQVLRVGLVRRWQVAELTGCVLPI